MPIDIHDKDALITAAYAADKPVAFIVGSPLSYDAGGGVPGIAPMLALVRDEIKSKVPAALPRFEDKLVGKNGGDAYQSAMRWLQGNLTQDAVNRVIAAAVRQARKSGASEDFKHDGDHKDWHLPQGTRQLAHLVTSNSERFPGPILTTNFDPLLWLSIEAQGGRATTRVIDSDGNVGRIVEGRPGVTEVVHLHGYWRDSDTLHTPTQLTAARPRLKASLQNLLRQRTLIVVAYAGWDDVFTTALAELLNDDQAQVNVLWCFYESTPALIEANYKRLLEHVAPAITRGRFLAYGGIDCHSIFAEIAGDSATSDSAMAESASVPLAGWTQVDAAYLAGLPPLRDSEILRYFDGATPTWRHALTEAIPRRREVAEIVKRFAEAQRTNDACSLQLVRAAGGEGKTTLLLQAAADLARAGNWSVLWRPEPSLGLPPHHVTELDESRQWLIVADDAENLVPDLDECTRRLHEAGRANIHFLLAARATEWLNAPGDTTVWRTRIKVQDAIVPHGISHGDAKAIIRAWERFGDAGLKQLARLKPRDRADLLVNKTRSEAGNGEEDSFFGALLDVRFSEAGLLAHVAQLLWPLRTMSIEHSTSTLLDALLYVAACHGVGIPGIDQRVLADLVGVPRDWLYSQVVNRLGEESFAVRNAGHIYIRHRKVAEAILVEAERTLGLDLAEVWERLVKQTVISGRDIRVGDTFSPILHAGPTLQRCLPKQLTEQRRIAIAIAAAKSAAVNQHEWLGCIVDLGNTYRLADDPPHALQVFRDHLGEAPGKVDYERVIRGYWYEWGMCEGLFGNAADHRAADAWLQALSISDHLNPAQLTNNDIKLSCAGLGVAFGKLVMNRPDCPYAKGRRAVAHIGRLSYPDTTAKGYFDRYDREADAMATPHPKDLAEAIGWLATATAKAGNELKDVFLRDLANPDSVTFQHLGSVLNSTGNRR